MRRPLEKFVHPKSETQGSLRIVAHNATDCLKSLPKRRAPHNFTLTADSLPQRKSLILFISDLQPGCSGFYTGIDSNLGASPRVE